MKTAKEFRAQARTVLTGRYWIAVLASLIAGALGGAGGSSGGAAGSSSGAGSSEAFAEGSSQISPEVWAFLAVVIGIISILAIAWLIVGSAVELGYNAFNIRLYETSEKPSVGMLFSRFSIFGKALGLRLLVMLKTLLWTLLFIIPGIIAAYRYSMAPYLMAEHPELTVTEAIEQSKTLMKGNKWRLFCLQLSFIGWILLAALTAGIGFIFLAPYIKAAETGFYRELTAAKAPAEEAPVAPAPVEGSPMQV